MCGQSLIEQCLIEKMALATDPVCILTARQVKDIREIPGILVSFMCLYDNLGACLE